MSQTHDYGYRLAVPGGFSRCRIRVYEAGGRTVCLATQRQDKFGGLALTGGAAQIAALAEGWHHPIHDDRFTWVEQYEFPLGGGPHGARETFAFVTFQRDAAGASCRPAWQLTDRAAVEALLGHAVGA
jgi:hypothetical protein